MRPVHPDDRTTLNAWCAARGVPGKSAKQMKMQGGIVDGVAAGFIMKTDAGVWYLTDYISCPQAAPRAVATALDQITAHLLGVAQRAGVGYVSALTASPSLIRRARRLGLMPHSPPYRYMSKHLT